MKKFFYKTLNGFFKVVNFLIKYPTFFILLIIAIAVAVALLMLNDKINVGGILGKVFGLFSNKTNIERANSIPKDRDAAIGEADKRGYVQHKVDQLESSINPFRDKTQVTLPDGSSVKLPKGIKDTDVDRIIEIDSEVQIIIKQENLNKLKDTREVVKKAKVVSNNANDLLARLKAKQ